MIAIVGTITSSLSDQPLRTAVSLATTHVHVTHEAERTFDLAELRGIVEVSFLRRFGIELQVPVRYRHTKSDELDRAQWGLGDLFITARAKLQLTGIRAIAKTGVTVPTGKTAPIDDLQFGTGTANPIFAVLFSERRGKVDVSLFGQALLVLYENRHHFRAGNQYAAGLHASLDVASWLTLILAADLWVQRPDKVGGEIRTGFSLPRTDVLLGASAAFHLAGFDLGIELRVPAYVHVIGEPGDIDYPGLLTISVGRGFSF